MNLMCRVIIGLFAAAYFVALLILGIGTYGLFGAERDPLSGVFLVPLGLPWNLIIDAAPEALLPWIGIGAPLVNLFLIWLVCRLFSRGNSRAEDQS